MTIAKSSLVFLGLPLCLLAAACAPPKGESWPSVSFGGEIAAIDQARAGAREVALAPLPALGQDDQAGGDNPAEYLQKIENNFIDLTLTLRDRRADYQRARAGLVENTSQADFQEHWLVAQMELSNISQNTEALKVIRAQIMQLGEPPTARAQALLSKVEALELDNRLFVRREKAFLNADPPE